MSRAGEKSVSAASRSRDAKRWAAVVQRDKAPDAGFFVAVVTTGIYCRPWCPSRLPKRANVSFYATAAEARAAGFRACKRCKPDERVLAALDGAKVTEACRQIEMAEVAPSLAQLAEVSGLSRYHFHRLFKAVTGVTPKAYAAAGRNSRVRSELADSKTVTEAIHNSGFNSNGRFYAASNAVLGMTPADYRQGGRNAVIRFAVGDCSLGSILVAASPKGVCAVLLGNAPEALLRDLQDRFPKAELIGGDRAFENLAAKVIAVVDEPGQRLDLPLDVRGTAFQHLVWTALRDIPPGATASYTDIAKRIGRPKSVRAVASACGANPVAVVIPCHRVVRNDGALSGYRWGIERKRVLLAKEAKLK